MKQATVDLGWFWFSWRWKIRDSKLEVWEVEKASLSKKRKALGPGNTTTDLTHAAGGFIYRQLTQLFNQCLFESKVPDEWKTIVILVDKEGDPKDIANFRPISSLNNISKLFIKIITNRIKDIINVIQPK